MRGFSFVDIIYKKWYNTTHSTMEHGIPDSRTEKQLALSPDQVFLASSKLPHGAPDTYGATPLDRVTTLHDQIKLADELRELTYRDVPDDIPLHILDYVHTTFSERFHSRAEANEENYLTALHTKQEFANDPWLAMMITKGEKGEASPSELLAVRACLGIRSIELACLTHPYGKKIDPVLSEMRSAVKQHVELMGGAYFAEPETRYRVKAFVPDEEGNDNFAHGLLMTRKRTLGVLPDGTMIRERYSFVLRTDDLAVIDKDTLNKLRKVDLKSATWQEDMVRDAQLDILAGLLLEENEYSFAVPISSTIYAYNPKTAQLIAERDQQERDQRWAEFSRLYPGLAAVATRGTDENGIYYVGPKPQ